MAKINQAMTDLLRYNSAIVPQVRSTFDKSHSHATTLDSGYIVPIMYDRVLPGDEKKIRYSGLARMATPIHPVMDEAVLDVHAFYVPDRLWWSNAKAFYGENLDASFNPDGEYEMPSLTPDQYALKSAEIHIQNDGIGSLRDYFGMPIHSNAVNGYVNDGMLPNISVGPFRCYQIIYNNYYRNTSIQPAVRVNTGDTVTDEEIAELFDLRKACKMPDYFTSLLREPQAGDDVYLPLGDSAPVVSRPQNIDLAKAYPFDDELGDVPQDYSIRFYDQFYRDGDNDLAGSVNVPSVPIIASDGRLFGTVNNQDGDNNGNGYKPVNLWADLTDATAATINNLRAAITVQQLLEIDNASGKFYQNIIAGHFGVFTPDGTLQRPELLGATRTQIGMRQVLQTSSTDETSPQGNTAAFSLTSVDNEWICNRAFSEPGFLIVTAVIRTSNSYSQGLDPLLTKLHRYDHYWPVFANLGNQPVYKWAVKADYDSSRALEEINNGDANDVFGYSMAWMEYRVKQNRVSGLFRPNAAQSLASWNYSTYLEFMPTLEGDFIEQDPDLIDRTIAVTDQPQFLLDNFFSYYDTKNMPVHSVPGLTRL